MPSKRQTGAKAFRVVVMGTAGVGKSSIVKQFIQHDFTDSYKETIEELHHHNMSLNGVNTEVDILDTSGTYQFPAMRKLAISSGDAFMLVYDLNNPETFETVKELRDQIKDCRHDTCSIIVVGNKIDLKDCIEECPENKVNESIVCLDWGESYVMTSAKNNDNIGELFKRIVSKCATNTKLGERRLTFQRRVSMPIMKLAKPSIKPQRRGVFNRSFSLDV